MMPHQICCSAYPNVLTVKAFAHMSSSDTPKDCCMQGTDQIRQAFSKRKRGLALKCYQLHKLTDAKVRCMPNFIFKCAFWQRAAAGKPQCFWK